MVNDNNEANWFPQQVIEKVSIEGKSLVQAWREYRNMSLEELAYRMRVSEAVIKVLERPNNRLSTASLQRISYVLGISVEQLII